jgi:hypothetical protein
MMTHRIVAALFLIALSSGPAIAAQTNHWARPFVASGGKLSPSPDACKTCHSDRHRDWVGSLHAGSFSPGFAVQLDPAKDPGFAESCYFCHAPAVEQREFLATSRGYAKNKGFDKAFQRSGVSCAACHLRAGTAKGPKSPALKPGDGGHPSAKDEIFKKSEFCAACHQADNGVALKGRALINTYREWKSSDYARKNVTCQSCHMPGGRHLFRGIHDAETARRAVEISTQNLSGRSGVKTILKMTNVGAGHYFPTYVTPVVVINAFLTDAGNRVMEHSVKKKAIGRYVSDDLKTEKFDTRIAPGESFEFFYGEGDAKGARNMVFEVTVYPDEFYARAFKAALKKNPESALLKEAARRATESKYLLYREVIKLEGQGY